MRTLFLIYLNCRNVTDVRDILNTAGCESYNPTVEPYLYDAS